MLPCGAALRPPGGTPSRAIRGSRRAGRDARLVAEAGLDGYAARAAVSSLPLCPGPAGYPPPKQLTPAGEKRLRIISIVLIALGLTSTFRMFAAGKRPPGSTPGA
jgi:hypothetical protein